MNILLLSIARMKHIPLMSGTVYTKSWNSILTAGQCGKYLSPFVPFPSRCSLSTLISSEEYCILCERLRNYLRFKSKNQLFCPTNNFNLFFDTLNNHCAVANMPAVSEISFGRSVSKLNKNPDKKRKQTKLKSYQVD